MPHTIEPAASGRASCRACGATIAKGELRFGERLPNPFAEEGEMTLWFHLACGAFKRPEAMLEALQAPAAASLYIEGREWLQHTAKQGVEHRRLPRANGAERASTARAACRSCREKIPKDSWRIRLEFFEDGRFNPSGFLHVACAEAYFGTREIFGRLKHFSSELRGEDEPSLLRALSDG